MTDAVLTNSGRVAIAKAIVAQPLHVAWGVGDGAWIAPPASGVSQTALISEIGRRTATEVAYVLPNVSGDIVLPEGRFSRSSTPTKYIYIRVTFDYADAPSSVIRELALFVGTQPISGLPAGKQYFTPGEIADPGLMLQVQNIGPLYRSPAVQETIDVLFQA